MYKKQLAYFIIICFEFLFNMEHSMAHMTLKQLADSAMVCICMTRIIIMHSIDSVGAIFEKNDLHIVNPVLEMRKRAHDIVYYLERLRA